MVPITIASVPIAVRNSPALRGISGRLANLPSVSCNAWRTLKIVNPKLSSESEVRVHDIKVRSAAINVFMTGRLGEVSVAVFSTTDDAFSDFASGVIEMPRCLSTKLYGNG